MYKKGAVILVLLNMLVIIGCFNIKGIAINRYASTEAFKLQLCGEEHEIEKTDFLGLLTEVTSGQRVLSVNIVERKSIIDLNEEDYHNLLKIVEAEAGGEDRKGKLLVANVVINRVKNEQFPDTVTDVIFQKEKGVSQFSPVSDGRFYCVTVSGETVEAVNAALSGEDVSKGALYFAARKSADSERMASFDKHLTKLFTHGGHEFFL